jgi:hypothetical protein
VTDAIPVMPLFSLSVYAVPLRQDHGRVARDLAVPLSCTPFAVIKGLVLAVCGDCVLVCCVLFVYIGTGRR